AALLQLAATDLGVRALPAAALRRYGAVCAARSVDHEDPAPLDRARLGTGPGAGHFGYLWRPSRLCDRGLRVLGGLGGPTDLGLGGALRARPVAGRRAGARGGASLPRARAARRRGGVPVGACRAAPRRGGLLGADPRRLRGAHELARPPGEPPPAPGRLCRR